jgi:hypothetical protein
MEEDFCYKLVLAPTERRAPPGRATAKIVFDSMAAAWEDLLLQGKLKRTAKPR